MNRSLRAALALWLVFMLICSGVLLYSLRFSYDLGLFLPPAKTAEQRVLVERLGEAPGSRFLLVGLPDASEDDSEAARAALEASGAFSRVLAGTPAAELADIPDVVWRYRYLLTDARLDASGLQQALAERSADLMLFAGQDFNTLLRADPTMAALSVLEGLATGSGDDDRWVTASGVPVLVVETAAPAFDLGAQASAVDTIRETLAALPETAARESVLSGPGAFGVELKGTIHAEARNRSLLASAALAIVLLIAYRRLPVLLLAGLPLITGAAAGLTAVTLLFPAVHGITLAFGFTLLGIAIDYPLHLFSHARHRSAGSAIVHLWPTLRLGVASTLIAYLTIAISGSPGPAQLGVFTAAGLLAAALVTRFVLPALASTRADTASDHSTHAVSLRWSPLLVLVIGGVALLAPGPQGQLWNNDLSALSPVPAERLLQDQAFRDAVGTPSLRYVIALRSPDLQDVLASTEALDRALGAAAADGMLQDWQAVTRVLPAVETQRLRQSSLPSAQALQAHMQGALQSTPFARDIFAPFFADVADATTLQPLEAGDFDPTPLAPFIASHLYRGATEWISLISLFGTLDAARLETWLEGRAGVPALVDFRNASETLVAGYRESTLRMLSAALVLILLLLLWRLPPARAAWCLALVICVVVATAGVSYALGGPLNLYHMMGLLLVAGLGLDYALFLSRDADGAVARADTRHAVLACAASTTVVFGTLGTSAIPALQSLGSTVATGTLLSVVTAWLGVRRDLMNNPG